MPIYSERSPRYGHSQFLDGIQVFEVDCCTLNSVGLSADTYGNIMVWPGTVLSKITATTFATYGQCMKRVSSPTYGPGSNVAIGILREAVDLTLGSKNVSYVVRGTVREDLIDDAGTIGTVAAATKTALSHIIWV